MREPKVIPTVNDGISTGASGAIDVSVYSVFELQFNPISDNQV